jgi:hypothetical protein
MGLSAGMKQVAKDASKEGQSDSIEAHSKTESLKIHYADLNEKGVFSKPDEWIDLTDEPDHQELCNREQRFFLKSILEDINLTDPTADAINSLKIAFACDESVKTGQVVLLNEDA